jgi:hypothetical protein
MEFFKLEHSIMTVQKESCNTTENGRAKTQYIYRYPLYSQIYV